MAFNLLRWEGYSTWDHLSDERLDKVLKKFLPLLTKYIHVLLNPNDDIRRYKHTSFEGIYRLVYKLTLHGHERREHAGALLDIVDIAVMAIHSGFVRSMGAWAGMSAQDRDAMLRVRSGMVSDVLLYLLRRHPNRRQEVTAAMQWANVMYYPGGPGYDAAMQAHNVRVASME